MKRIAVLYLFIFIFFLPSCRSYRCDDKLKPSEKQRMSARLQRKKDRAYKKQMKKKKKEGKYTGVIVDKTAVSLIGW